MKGLAGAATLTRVLLAVYISIPSGRDQVGNCTSLAWPYGCRPRRLVGRPPASSSGRARWPCARAARAAASFDAPLSPSQPTWLANSRQEKKKVRGDTTKRRAK